MRFITLLGVAGAIAASAATASFASPNVALTSQGASFVSASTACCGLSGSTLAIMQNDPISDTPTPWSSNGDYRYIFVDGDQAQTYEIKLGGTYALDAFSTSFGSANRQVTGPFTIDVSLDGTTFTSVAGVLGVSTTGGVVTDTLSLLSSVDALYVRYGFGPSAQADFSGAGILSVTADGVATSAAPEPSTWALMFAGVGLAGFALRSRKQLALAST